jgi:hypothetical protein
MAGAGPNVHPEVSNRFALANTTENQTFAAAHRRAKDIFPADNLKTELAENISAGTAESCLCGGIPANNLALSINGEGRIVGAFEACREALRSDVHAVPGVCCSSPEASELPYSFTSFCRIGCYSQTSGEIPPESTATWRPTRARIVNKLHKSITTTFDKSIYLRGTSAHVIKRGRPNSGRTTPFLLGRQVIDQPGEC